MIGVLRRIDAALIAPEASVAERGIGYATAFAGAATAVALGLAANWSPLALGVVAVIGFDLFGGATVNAMSSAKRWWHRPGRTARHHLTFVAVHVQPFLLALLVPGFGWVAATAVYAVLLVGAVVVLAAPLPVRRPVAFAVSCLAITALTALLTIPASLVWLVPVLTIKLLLSHLLPEEAA